MARGNNFTILSGTGTLAKTLYAERNTILVLNPSNGVVYVKINAASDPLTWDWIVPAQSRAYLPGPWLEYGLYYVDQSGAGQSGNITVYETDQKIDLPDYGAIGVARIALQTTMDVTEGTVPANPGGGILRIWADAAHHLHVLQNNGTDAVVVDYRVPLGGSLSGFLPNPAIANAVISGGNIAPNSIAGWDSLINGSVTNASLQNGSVDNNKLAVGAAWANLAPLTILAPIGSLNVGADQWTNVGLAAGYNTFPGSSGQVVASVPENTDLVFINVNAEVLLVAPNATTNCGWAFYIDGGLYREGPKINVIAGATVACPWTAFFMVAGPSTLSGAIASGSHTFELRFYNQNGIANGAYMRPASTGYATERMQIEMLVSRR